MLGQPILAENRELARRLRREMTPAERRLWAHLRRNQVEGLHFRRQQVIQGFVVDFYCHAAALIIEVDGGIHADQADYDAEREAMLVARGFVIARFRNDEVLLQLDSVLDRIRAICLERL